MATLWQLRGLRVCYDVYVVVTGVYVPLFFAKIALRHAVRGSSGTDLREGVTVASERILTWKRWTRAPVYIRIYNRSVKHHRMKPRHLHIATSRRHHPTCIGCRPRNRNKELMLIFRSVPVWQWPLSLCLLHSIGSKDNIMILYQNHETCIR